jgi:hypothetical protein
MQHSFLQLLRGLFLLFVCSSLSLQAQDLKVTTYRDGFDVQKFIYSADKYFCFTPEELFVVDENGTVLKTFEDKAGYTKLPSNVWEQKGNIYFAYEESCFQLSIKDLKVSSIKEKELETNYLKMSALPESQTMEFPLLWTAKFLKSYEYYEFQIDLYINGKKQRTKAKLDCSGDFQIFKDHAGEIWLWSSKNEDCTYRWRTDLEAWEPIYALADVKLQGVASNVPTYIFHQNGGITKLHYGKGQRYMDVYSMWTKYDAFVENKIDLIGDYLVAADWGKGLLYLIEEYYEVDSFDFKETADVNTLKLPKVEDASYLAYTAGKNKSIHAIRKGAIDIYDPKKGLQKTITVKKASLPNGGIINDFQLDKNNKLYAIIGNRFYREGAKGLERFLGSEKANLGKERFEYLAIDQKGYVFGQLQTDYPGIFDPNRYFDSTLLLHESGKWDFLLTGGKIHRVFSSPNMDGIYAIVIQKSKSDSKKIEHKLVYQRSKSDPQIYDIPLISGLSDEYAGFHHKQAVIDAKGTFWLQHPKEGLYSLNKDGLKHHDDAESFLYRNGKRLSYNRLYPLADGGLLIKNSNGLAIYKDGQFQELKLSKAQKKCFADDRYPEVQYSGSRVYHRLDNKIYYYEGGEWKNYSLNGKMYYNSKLLFVDSKDRVWITRLGRHLDCFDAKGKKVLTVDYQGPLFKIVEGQDGTVWIGTNSAIYKVSE